MALAAPDVNFGSAYVAQDLGYFKKAGIKVKILSSSGSNTTNLVASGQAQLGEIGPGGPLEMAKAGKATTILYNNADAAAAGYLVAGMKYKDFASLKGQRMAAFGVGSGTYGFATKYANSFKMKTVVPFTTASAMAAAVASGQAAAGTGAYTNYSQLIAQGKAHVLIDPNVPAQRRKYVGKPYPAGTAFGLTSWVTGHRKDVVAYLQGRNAGLKWMRNHSTAEVVTELQKASGMYKAIKKSALTEAVKKSKPFNSPDWGYISQATWNYALKQYTGWGIQGFDAKAQINSYSTRLDMSYLRAANKNLGIQTPGQ